MEQDVVFKQNCPGLGDSLQFSTLPERYSRKGKRFFLHKTNTTLNEGINDLVWSENPFVEKKKSDKEINCFYHQHLTPYLSEKYGVRNFVEWAEFSHGFEVQNSVPKIYYKTKKIDFFSNLDVLDVGSITCFRRGFYSHQDLVELIKDTIDTARTLLINSKFSNSPILKDFQFLKKIDIESIFHYADIISSCETFYCLYSGSSSLGSAIRPHGSFVFFPDINRAKEISGGSHLFPNNQYYCSDKTFLNNRKDWRF